MDKSNNYGATEQKILDAATKVFLKKGLYGARTQEIANEAGINKALLHYYFRNKDKLFQAIFERTFQSFAPLIVQIFNNEDPIHDKIKQLVNEYIDFLSANPYLPLFLINEIHQNPKRQLPIHQIKGKLKSSRFMQQFEEKVKAGVFVPIKPEQFITNLLALIIFPFINKSMLSSVFSMDETKFDNFIQERKVFVPDMILRAITIDPKQKV